MLRVKIELNIYKSQGTLFTSKNDGSQRIKRYKYFWTKIDAAKLFLHRKNQETFSMVRNNVMKRVGGRLSSSVWHDIP